MKDGDWSLESFLFYFAVFDCSSNLFFYFSVILVVNIEQLRVTTKSGALMRK